MISEDMMTIVMLEFYLRYGRSPHDDELAIIIAELERGLNEASDSSEAI